MKSKAPATAARNAWIPAKERKWVLAFLGLAVVLVLFGLWNMLHSGSMTWHGRHFKGLFTSYGSYARILLFAVLSFYVLMIAMKKRLLDRWSLLKKLAVTVLKYARQFHVPLAIVAIGLIALHVVGALLYGLRPDFTDISGLTAASVLLGVPVAGVLRYRRLDRKWHLRLGLLFAALFLVHAFL